MTAVAPLQPETVRVRWLEVDDTASTKLARWRDLLDEQEQARADRFRFARDRDVFIAAHALLRSMLSEATGVSPDTWRFSIGRYGKPAVADDSAAGGLRFNLTHTAGLAACAIARDDIGVDVEAAERRVDLDLAERFFAPSEVLAVRSAAPERRTELFFRFWTLKEAFIKATGEGLNRRLASFSFTLDPVRISFHPLDALDPCKEDPEQWQFAEYRPRQDRPLAMALRRSATRPCGLDARGACDLCERWLSPA